MFDIGFLEIALIGAIALLVFGPERLPELARTLGRWVGRMRRMVNSVRNDIERELQIEELEELRKLKRELDPRRASRWLAESRDEFERGLNTPVITENDLRGGDDAAGSAAASPPAADEDGAPAADAGANTGANTGAESRPPPPTASIWDTPGEEVDDEAAPDADEPTAPGPRDDNRKAP